MSPCHDRTETGRRRSRSSQASQPPSPGRTLPSSRPSGPARRCHDDDDRFVLRSNDPQRHDLDNRPLHDARTDPLCLVVPRSATANRLPAPAPSLRSQNPERFHLRTTHKVAEPQPPFWCNPSPSAPLSGPRADPDPQKL